MQRFKRLSASLHVKDSRCCVLPGRNCFKRLSASLHVKVRNFRLIFLQGRRFKRLSASLHVKVDS